ncbi:nSTAND1 domain-containing NTPase [Streptomyces eurythermus]
MGRPENPIDPEAGPVQRFAVGLRALRAEAGGPTYRSMAQRTPYSAAALSQAAAGERLPSAEVTRAYVTACGGDPDEWEKRRRAAADELAALPHEGQDARDSPYRGLARFEPGDAAVFFGRDQLVADLAELVRGHRCAVVLGPSGSGKSSLLRAGLIPRLRRTADADAPLAAIRVLTPGPHPARSHADKLRPAGEDGDTLVVVDQFEEVFTLCPDQRERARFIEALLAARQPGSRLRVVLGVRADFYGRCLEHPELARVLRDAAVPVPAMGREELREAVVRPAMARGLTVERALTAQLVDEVAGEPGGLPLLSHALLETWRRRSGRTLTLRAYEAAGGVRGAIAQTAEDLYAGLSDGQADLVRRVLLRLITPGEGTADTCRPVRRAELRTTGPHSAGTVDTVLERLARARLITLDGETVHLAHEALITAWPRLWGWIEDDRHRLRVLRRLTEAAESWRELGRDPGALYRGTRLAEAAEAFDPADRDRELSAVEREFLHASTAAHARERRRLRGLTGSVSVLLVLALVAGAVAWQQHRTNERRHLAATARRAATAAEGLRTTDPGTALRLGVAAWRLSRTPETRSALIGALAQRDLPTFTVPDPADTQLLSPDGRTLFGLGGGRFVRRDLATRRVTDSRRLPAGTDDLTMGDMSPDGRYVSVPAGEDGLRVRMWDTRTGRYHGPVLGPSDGGLGTLAEPLADDGPESAGGEGDTLVGAVSGTRAEFGFSSSGHAYLFLTGSRLEVWDTDSGHRLFTHTAKELETAGGGDISPDNRLVAMCVQGGVGVWDIPARRRVDTGWRKRFACGPEARLQFSPDSRTLTTTDTTGIRRVTVRTGTQPPPLAQVAPLSYVFSADGTLLAGVGGNDLLLWRLDHPQAPVVRYPLNDVQPDDIRIDTTARVLRYTAAGSDGVTVVHGVDISSALSPHWSTRAAAAAALSADGSVLAVLDSGGKGPARLRIHDGHTGRPRYTISAPGVPVESDATSGGGETVLSLSADGRRLAFGSGPADPMGPTRITVWDTVRDRKLTELKPYDDDMPPAGWVLSPDGRSLLTTGIDDATVTVWDAGSGRKTGDIRFPGPGNGRDDTGAGGTVDSMSHDGGVLLMSDGTLLPADGHGGRRETMDCACASVLSPDGKRAAFADIDGGITVWDVERATSLGTLPDGYFRGATGGQEETTALVFSPDGGVLAAAGAQGTVRLWDVDSRRRLGTDLPTAGDRVLALAFTGDGGSLLVAGEHVPFQRVPLDPDRVAETVCRRAGGGPSRAEWRVYVADVPFRSVC